MQQHTATHCNTLQPTAAHCNKLQRTITHCNILQRTATHCNTQHYTVVTLQHTAAHRAVHHTKTHCNIPQHIAPHTNTCPTHQHIATHYNTLHIYIQTCMCQMGDDPHRTPRLEIEPFGSRNRMSVHDSYCMLYSRCVCRGGGIVIFFFRVPWLSK